jgi:hypothetical protein
VVEEYGNVKFDDSNRMCSTAPNDTSGSISPGTSLFPNNINN